MAMPERIWAWDDPEFAANVQPHGSCLIWTGRAQPNGYAQFKGQYVHRRAYEEHVGEILPGLSIDHICRNPLCVNPDHLRMMPMGDNSLRGDGPAARNARKTVCINGHSLTGDNVLLQDRKDGIARKCLACERERKARMRAKKVEALSLGGISPAQETLMLALSHCEDGIGSADQVSAMMGHGNMDEVRFGTLSRLRVLMRAGLVVRLPQPRPSAIVQWALTEAGRQVLERRYLASVGGNDV